MELLEWLSLEGESKIRQNFAQTNLMVKRWELSMLPGGAERSDGLSALLFRDSEQESPKTKVRSGSKRALGSYHETHKGAGLKPIG